MKWIAPLSLALLMAACGGPSDADHVGAVPKTPGAASARQSPDPLDQMAPDAEQHVTLVGCLIGSTSTAPAGTSGTGSPAPASAASDASIAARRFTLVDAKPEGDAGVGANGAGGTGGPLVSGTASYALDGLPNGALGDVNTIVRITGTVDPRAVGARRVEVLSVEPLGRACGR